MVHFSDLFLHVITPVLIGYVISELRHFGKGLAESRSGAVVDKDRYKIDSMITVIKEEITEPLIAMDGYLHIADSDPSVPYFVKMNIAHAHDTVEKMSNFLHRLMLLHSIESPTYLPKLEPINITTLVFTSCREFSAKAEARSIHFNWNVDNALYRVYRSSYDLIEIIITSLVSNSITYTIQGEVSLNAKKTKSGIEITVKDTGIGISELMCKELFESQIEDRLHFENQKGVGILLLRHAVQNLKGSLTYQSTPGVGTSITVQFPIQKVPAGTIPAHKSEPTLTIIAHTLPKDYLEYFQGCGHIVIEQNEVTKIPSLLSKKKKFDMIICGAETTDIESFQNLSIPVVMLTKEITDYFERSDKGNKLILPSDLGPDELLWLSSYFISAQGNTHESSTDLLSYEPDELLDSYLKQKDLASLLEWLREASLLGDIHECELVFKRIHTLMKGDEELGILEAAINVYDFVKIRKITHLIARRINVILFGGRNV